MEESEKPTLMQLQASLPVKIAVTIGIMLVLILLVYVFNIPNPNMILIAGLVLCSALFGYGGGTVAAIIMLGYTLFFFSTNHSFTQFTPENMQKVMVSIIGIAADMLLVCSLKEAELKAFKRVDALTQELHIDNEKLQKMSTTDALTDIKNRMALRQDYDSYLGHKVSVLVVDIDNFKLINDTYGHEEGDRALREAASLIVDIFGKDYCYRYGGDEFLVIVPDMPDQDFQKKLEVLHGSSLAIEGAPDVGFSFGYVHAELVDSDALRTLISKADEKMYEMKRDKKHMLAQEGVPQHSSPVVMESSEIASEYSATELKSFLDKMSESYDLARVVDPVECRVIEIREDGTVGMNESCYGIWSSEQRCLNCSSAIACRTGNCQRKAEHFEDNVYLIESNPVKLTLTDGTVFDAVVELVNIEGEEADVVANDREAENVGNRAARYISHHDSLTSVLYADAFYELSREMIENNPETPWVMITGNIMNFRLVNTLFGDIKGNDVLVRTAALLREITEEADGLCGRLGGDQFALLVPRARYREEHLTNAAQTLAATFNSGIYVFCMHFGVYELDDPSIPVSVMCGRANSALRTIREDVTRTVAYFDDNIMQGLLREQRVISRFETALEEGQFKMYLQPLVEKDGTIIGAEALTRWIKPDGTTVMPGDFIDTLENAGLIQRLDMHIWELAVKQLASWKGTPKENLTISVNMSAKDFFSIDVYEVLSGLIDRYGVNSGQLRLEITETALLVDQAKSDAIVHKLRKRGFIVEIDDYGKGYSSLSLLKSIKADVLKIDMSLVREIENDARNSVILASVINLAESLGMDVITEGVETEQQLQILAEMGCSHFQGYLFSRPIPVAEFEAKVDARERYN